MKKVFKAAIFSLSALALPLALSATARANALIKDSIDTTLEYQVNSSGDSMRFISTMVLNDSKTLNDITKIDMDFKLTKSEQDDKDSVTKTTTKVYESISGENGKAKVDNTYYAVLTITDLTTFEGWRITPTFTYTFADDSTEEATASTWLIGGKRVYFTNSYNWEQVSVFMYKDGGNTNGEWPGQAMTLLDADHGVYYYDYLPSQNYDSIIFNNNNHGRQTEDILLDADVHSYSLGKMKSDGKYEGQGSSCTTHSWGADFETDGATHYHVCSVCGAKSKITDNNMQPVEGQSGVYQDQYSSYSGMKENGYIYIQDSYYGSYNSGLNIHYWGGTNPAGTNWPGIQINTNDYYFTTDMYGRNIYKVYVGDNTGFLLVNGTGNDENGKTRDVATSEGNAFYLGDNWSVGAYNICPLPALG